MTVISSSYFSLIRARKELEKAFQQGRWDDVKSWDIRLGVSLNKAFEDEQCNTAELVQELERILNTYANVVRGMPEKAMSLTQAPK